MTGYLFRGPGKAAGQCGYRKYANTGTAGKPKCKKLSYIFTTEVLEGNIGKHKDLSNTGTRIAKSAFGKQNVKNIIIIS